MNSDMEDSLRQVKCCSCMKPVSGSKHVNIMMLDRKATWKYPVYENILLKDGIPHISRAIAVMCDSCIEEKKDARFAIEFNGENVIYHDVGLLEKLFRIKPEMLIEE